MLKVNAPIVSEPEPIRTQRSVQPNINWLIAIYHIYLKAPHWIWFRPEIFILGSNPAWLTFVEPGTLLTFRWLSNAFATDQHQRLHWIVRSKIVSSFVINVEKVIVLFQDDWRFSSVGWKGVVIIRSQIRTQESIQRHTIERVYTSFSHVFGRRISSNYFLIWFWNFKQKFLWFLTFFLMATFFELPPPPPS